MGCKIIYGRDRGSALDASTVVMSGVERTSELALTMFLLFFVTRMYPARSNDDDEMYSMNKP